jgi:jumonji domain-containing protein 2
MNYLNDPVSLERDIKSNQILGVNSPYLYIGSWRTSFAFHVEDYNLYSTSFLHIGAPKTWYIIPPKFGKEFEAFSRKYLKFGCKDVIKHKIFMPSPRAIKDNKIGFDKIRQSAGEFVVTFPYAFHGGFNNGFNIAEAINFGTKFWFDGEYNNFKENCDCGQYKLCFKFDNDVLAGLINNKQ